MGLIHTDELTFGEAFRYYRNCLGNNNEFQWKRMQYTTLTLEEVIILLADSEKVYYNSEKEEISQIQ